MNIKVAAFTVSEKSSNTCYTNNAMELFWGPQGFWGSGKNDYLFSGIYGALVFILGDMGSKHIVLGI